MKPTRIFATASLVISSFALITAASISVGDEPGVVRMARSSQQENAPAPSPEMAVPPVPNSTGVATLNQSPSGAGSVQAPAYDPGVYPQPSPYAPYFDRSMGATSVLPNVFYTPEQPFGPIIGLDTNLGSGLGYEEGYQRLSARLPYHIVPNTNVLLGDIQASVTFDGSPVASAGLIMRNYDEVANRVFGVNAYVDYDEGYGYGDWTRITAGLESLGRYIDYRVNGYFMVGSDSEIVSSTLSPALGLSGSNVYKLRTQVRENAYSGLNGELGGPVPWLGRYGVNLYGGAYFLTNDFGDDTVGGQARIETLITQNISVNTYLTSDDTFDNNVWVNLTYEFPNYRPQRTLRAKTVRERLQDAVVRNNRIQTHIDRVIVPEALINPATGLPFTFVHVNPNAALPGIGTFERPYNQLQLAANNNNAGVDIIRVQPRADDTGTNLTANGGLSLFDNQTLLSSLKPLVLAPDCIVPASSTTSNLGPLISNPLNGPGGSVVHLANNNSVIGMRISGANAAGTAFGNGISNALPITDVNIVCNTFTNYVFGASLQDVSGRVIVDQNIFDGLLGLSQNGLDLSIAAGSTADVLVRENTANDNSGVGLNIIAEANSTLNADNPNGTVPTGIIDNVASDNGTGINIEARPGAEVNAVVEGNTAERNTFDGLKMVSDNGTFNLASLANNNFNSNLNNGTFIHYLNGGIFRSVSEDVDGDGVLDPGEDLNGNGDLDQGIVSNNMNDNLIAGLCIFGEDASTGTFDVGGPTAALGNTFNGNLEGGVLVDLRDTATAQVDALFNRITGGNSAPATTIVLDFIDPGQPSEVDISGFQVNTFDVTAFGFSQSQYDTVTNAVLATLKEYYRDLPTASEDSRSPIPDGQELNIDFVIGDTGVAPSNGATEYYVMTIGESPAAAAFGLGGLAGDIGNIRNAQGQGPGQGLSGTPQPLGGSAMGVYTDSIASISPALNPPNALNLNPENGGTFIDNSNAPAFAINALTSGNLTYTRRALGYIAAHELGHTVSLRHVQVAGSVTPNNLPPIMSTPAMDGTVQSIIEPAEFGFSGTNPGEIPGEQPFVQNDIAQLVAALGTRATAGETKNGIKVNATGNSRLLESTFNNNTVTGASENGIAIHMHDNAVAEDVTIQGDQITNGGGNGISLVADGPGAEIHADNTIGGAGVNVYNGTSYTQSNTITNNAGDGFRALAAHDGLIHGNLINNTITDNGGNGAALLIDDGGFVDFGTVANNRVIRGNTITGNGGAGLLLNQLTAPDTEAQIDATVLGNDISNNLGGGIVAELNGANNSPPALPVLVNNNRLNLKVGGAALTDANSINGNSDVGIGVDVAGNGNAIVDLQNVTVTGTIDGADPLKNGSGIDLRRSDSSLLTATLNKVTSTGNAGDGLHVDTQGNDKTDPNQPNSGTPNMITVTDSNFSTNGQNGALFITRGDSTTIADIKNSTFMRNGRDGIGVQTSEDSSFGDPTIGLPPGRRSLFDGNVIEENVRDGVNIVATEDSRALVHITSNAVPATTSAHAAASRLGATSISNNGRDGVRIETTGGRSDILVDSGSATTTISGNGTVAGGNGIRWDASGDSDAVVRVNSTIIENNISGATELNDANGNGDVDVADGDGIQANFSQDTTSTLIVGGVNSGNFIRNNGNDGIALTATGSNATGNPRPVISIVGNTIGGTIDGLPAGNGGHGVNLNVFGGTAVGIPPAAVDFTLPFISFNGGVTESGPVPQLTMTDNLISNNQRRGVNLLLTGAAGFRDRENGASLFDPVRITLADNTIISNGEEGVFMRGDSNMNQSRFVYLPNFPDPPVTNNDNQNFSPFRGEFFALNFGSVNGNTAYLAPYMNLRTVQNSFLTLTNNTIQNNGTNTVTGEGVRIDVGTGAYVAADVQGNVFGGNLEEDFVTSSFLSAGNTFDSQDTSGNLTFDYIYLDDTAQFDLRFQNNQGNQIAPSELGAIYTNLDLLKAQFFGVVGVQNRQVSLFQVDNGPNLNNPNNTFVTFGVTQDVQQSFTNGGYNLRGAADPLFPNIGFAPFLP